MTTAPYPWTRDGSYLVYGAERHWVKHRMVEYCRAADGERVFYYWYVGGRAPARLEALCRLPDVLRRVNHGKHEQNRLDHLALVPSVDGEPVPVPERSVRGKGCRLDYWQTVRQGDGHRAECWTAAHGWVSSEGEHRTTAEKYLREKLRRLGVL